MLASHNVGKGSVALVAGESNPSPHPFRNRAADRTLHIVSVEPAVRRLKIAIEMIGRRCANIVDQTASRVATKQGTLGAAQDFHPLEVKGRHGNCARSANIAFVLVNCDWGFKMVREVILGDTAHA